MRHGALRLYALVFRRFVVQGLPSRKVFPRSRARHPTRGAPGALNLKPLQHTCSQQLLARGFAIGNAIGHRTQQRKQNADTTSWFMRGMVRGEAMGANVQLLVSLSRFSCHAVASTS